MSLNDERILIERISRWPNCEKAFAFVLKTWGSSPLPAGSMLAISDSGKFEGSLSGGCVENSVIEESAEVIVAAKNNDKSELKNEVADLLYHLLVLLHHQGLCLDDVESVLSHRHRS